MSNTNNPDYHEKKSFDAEWTAKESQWEERLEDIADTIEIYFEEESELTWEQLCNEANKMGFTVKESEILYDNFEIVRFCKNGKAICYKYVPCLDKFDYVSVDRTYAKMLNMMKEILAC